MPADSAFDLFEDLGDGFDHVICGTYGIRADFLEQFLLRHVPAFAHAERVTVLVDARQARVEYATVRATLANRRYVLHPIDRGSGRFHSKFILAVGANRALAVVGSANLNEGAWGRNLELVGAVTATPDEPDGDGVIVALIDYVESVLARNPSRAVARSLAELRSVGHWLQPTTSTQLLTSATSLLDQLGERIAGAGERVDRVDALAPFHDGSLGFLSAVRERLRPKEIRLFVPVGQGLTQGVGAWARSAGISLRAYAVAPTEDRTLHAKAFSLRTDASEWFAFGSANATSAAMLGGQRGNDELLVLRQGKRRPKSGVELLLAKVASIEEVSPDSMPRIVIDNEPDEPRRALRVLEAEREGNRVRFSIDRAALPDAVRVRLRPADGEARTASATAFDGAWRTSELDRASEIFRGTTRLDLVALDGDVLSNDVFVLDLIEHRDASNAVRRAVAKANATALGVDLALAMLRELGDERALVEFFWFVNVRGIPMPGLRSLSRAGQVPAPYVPKEPLDFRQQLELDTALDYFWRRHLRRLVGIVEDPSIGTVPVAMHLLAALHAGLDVQIGHVLARVRRDRTMTFDEWKDARNLMDRALVRYRDVAKAVARLGIDASPRMRATLREHLAELNRGRDLVAGWHADVERARRTLRIAVPHRPEVPAEYFDGNVMRRWGEYEKRLSSTIGNLVAQLAA